MILVELRPLLLVLIALALIYVFYLIAKKILRTESIKEAIDDRKEEIEETMKFSENLPKIDKNKVSKAADKIKKFLK